jgi:prepilin-type N-terminal cleavage/methylation domain-containing protein
MRNEKGVTLLEVVSCLMVIGVLSGIALPASQAMMVRYTFSTETARVIDALKLAKSYAITKKSPVVFSYSQDGYLVFIDDGAGGGKGGDWIRQPGERLLAECDLREKGLHIDVGLSTFSAKRTRFSGTPAIKAGSVVLVGADGSKTKIVINIIGRVRTERLI